MNIKAARLLAIPHVNCHNHLLNAEINQWIKQNHIIKETVDTAQEEMKIARGSLKNQAVLRKTTNLKPEVGNATRWTSWGTMMMKHRRMSDDLREASLQPNNTIQADQSWVFQSRAMKVTKMFEDINMTAVSMQTRLYPLHLVCEDCDSLLQESQEGHDITGSAWFGSKLNGTHITRDSPKITHPHFVTGVIKIQTNKHAMLTIEEKEACESLLAEDGNEGDPQPTNQRLSLADKMKDRIKKRKAGVIEGDLTSPYKNVDFICGSAAEVERLWSVAKYILTDNRSRMTPAMFESLLFLKTNEEYWDMSMVMEAYTRVRNDLPNNRVTAMMTEDNEELEEM